MGNQTDQAAFFAYSGGKSLSPAVQDAFHAGWRARADLVAERIAELEDKLFALRAMEKPPCFCCGYNGSGYYNSKMHPCAKRHHELKEKG